MDAALSLGLGLIPVLIRTDYILVRISVSYNHKGPSVEEAALTQHTSEETVHCFIQHTSELKEQFTVSFNRSLN